MQKAGAALAFFVLGAVAAPIFDAPPLDGFGSAAATLLVGLCGAFLVRWIGPRGLRPPILVAVVATAVGFAHNYRSPDALPPSSELLFPTHIAGTVESVKTSARGARTLVGLAGAETASGREIPNAVRVRWPSDAAPPLPGDEITAFGMLEVSGRGRLLDPVVTENVIVRPTLTSRLRRSVEVVRHGLAARADRSLSRLGADLTVSLCLGIDRDADQWRDHLARAGALHFFAVSGFQLAVLLVFLRRLTAPIGSWPRLRVFLQSIALVAYTAISGGEAPVVRALLMGLVLFSARMLRRPFVAGYALIVAAALQIAVDPKTAADVGFLLSMTAMAGLIWLVPPLSQRPPSDVIGRFLDKKKRRPITAYVVKNAVATIAAIIVTSPIAVGTFGVFHVAGLVGNLLLVPLVSAHFIVGLFFLIGVPCGPIVDLLAVAIHRTVLFISESPGTAYPTDPPFLVALVHTVAVAAAVLLSCRIGDRRARPIMILPIATLVVCIIWPVPTEDPWVATRGDDDSFSVAVVDGTSAFVLLTGPRESRIERSFFRRLEKEGVRTIEALVQFDADALDREARRESLSPDLDLAISELGTADIVVEGKTLRAGAGDMTLNAGPFRIRTEFINSALHPTPILIVQTSRQTVLLGMERSDAMKALAESHGAVAIILWRHPKTEFPGTTASTVTILAPRQPAASERRSSRALGGVTLVERRFTLTVIPNPP